MDEELDLVTFSDEDGNEFTMEVLDYFFYEGKEYALLAEVEDDCECDACDHDDDCDCGCEEREAYIMEVVPVGDDEEEFVPVDEELAERLIEMVENQLYDDEDEDDEEDDDAEEALEALEEDGFFELECPNCGDTLVVDKSVLDSGSVACPGCGQEFEIELGYEDEEEDSDEE